jgi:hypothetical protein
MDTSPHQVYPDHAKGIWVLYDLRCPEARHYLREQRATWQELSDLATLGPDHMVLMLSPGGAADATSMTKELRHG